jgi:hypothetical protein
MENIMSVKIIATLTAAVLLGTTALASAAESPSRHHQLAAVTTQDPFAGTPYENVVPYGSERLANPYAGTVFDGVAPY